MLARCEYVDHGSTRSRDRNRTSDNFLFSKSSHSHGIAYFFPNHQPPGHIERQSRGLQQVRKSSYSRARRS